MTRLIMKRHVSLLACLALVPATVAAQTPPAGASNGNPPRVPRPAPVEGRPVESRPPEKKDNAPAFPEQTRAPYHATAPFTVTTLIDNLQAPWSLAFLPGGSLLVTERLPGRMHILDAKGVLSAPLAGVSVVASPKATDIGLLDVVLDPDFGRSHRIFFTFYDFVDGTNSNTCVARGRLDEAKQAVTDVSVIFRAQPAIPSKRLGGKTGGRIAIGNDGNLFVTVGDRSDSPPWDVAQRMDTHLGKIVHITPDGAPAPDNPFLNKPGVLPEIWASGLRNGEGLAFDPRTGRLWEHEHGPRGGDELNVIEKGKNYGWPVIAHGVDYPGTPIGEGLTHKDGMEEPVYYWDPVIAPSGLAFYTGTLFPEWKDSVFVGGLNGRVLDRLTLVNGKVMAEEPLLTDLGARIRDVRVGPDGAVYVLTDSGTPTVSPNTPPTSRLLKLTPAARRPSSAADSGSYRFVDNWATFPAGMTAWSSATGVDIDATGNIYVFHRNPAMPIMAFDKDGRFLRAWGQNMFKTTHFLRTDRAGHVWVTDRGDHQVFEFSADGTLLMTLGRKGVAGDNESRDAFNGVADLVIAKNGDIFIADGESTNTRVVKYSKEGTFVAWWGGKGTEPGKFDEPHSIAIDAQGRLYVGDRRNKRVQVFDQRGTFITQWTNLGTPWGVFVKGDRLYVVDGTENNCLYIASITDGSVIERIDGLKNPTAVTVDEQGAIYIAEVNGANVRKLVKAK